MSRLKELEALMEPLPKYAGFPPEGYKNITIVNGEIRPEVASLSDEARMRSLDEMLEKSVEIVQNLVVIQGAMVRSMPFVTITNTHVSLRVRIFVPI